MRRSFDGLAEVVRQVVQKDPLSGALFLFVNRPSDRLKLLWWDRSGYCILYKRLERGTFRLPQVEPGATSVRIESAELVTSSSKDSLRGRANRARRRVKNRDELAVVTSGDPI
jgi:transposase